jgi:hypothetical protein
VSDDRAVPVIGGNHRILWVAAVLLYGVGDTATTFWGLSIGGVAEAGAVAGPLIGAHGPFALVGIKLIVFLAFSLVWQLLRTPGRVAVPFALAVVGGVVTAWNLVVIASGL